MRGLFADLLALLRGSGAGMARAAAPEVRLPFAPPLGTPIRYAYLSRRWRRGMVQITRAVEEMTVFAAADGYRLQWVTRSAEQDATGEHAAAIAPMLAVMNRLTATTIGRPLLFDLDQEGTLIGLANMAEWRAQQQMMLAGLADGMDEQFAGLAGTDRDSLAAIFANVVAEYAAQSDEQFLNDMADTPSMVLHGGLSLPAGQDLDFTVSKPARLGDVMVNQQVGVRLDLHAGGRGARVQMKTAIDPADVLRLAQQLQALATSADAQDAPAARLSDADAPDLREQTNQLILLPSGLVQRASFQRSAAAGGQLRRIEDRIIRMQR